MGDLQLGGGTRECECWGETYMESIELPALQVKLSFGPSMNADEDGLAIWGLSPVNCGVMPLDKSCNPVIKNHRA